MNTWQDGRAVCGPYRIHAALYHGRFRDQAGENAGNVTLQDVKIRGVFLLVSVVWVRWGANMVT